MDGVSHHMGAETRTQVLYKSKRCFKSLGQLSSLKSLGVLFLIFLFHHEILTEISVMKNWVYTGWVANYFP